MESAFGVDHGVEISKLSPGGMLKPMGSAISNAGKGASTAWKAKGNDFTPMKPLGGSKAYVAGARAGAFASRNKGPITAGSVGAGLGGAGYASGRNFQNKQKQV